MSSRRTCGCSRLYIWNIVNKDVLQNFTSVFCVGICETLKWKVEWADLVSLPARIRPMGLGGHGHGRGRGGGRLPSQHITFPKMMKYVEEAGKRSKKQEKIKEEKKVFCKKVLQQKAKRDRLVKKLKFQGEM